MEMKAERRNREDENEPSVTLMGQKERSRKKKSARREISRVKSLKEANHPAE
jgi:hypothetical protein